MVPEPSMSTMVFAVHTARPDEIGAVEIIFLDEDDARSYASDRSRDWRVLSASVTSYVIGQLGTRHPVVAYADGVEINPRSIARMYPTDGPAGPAGPLGFEGRGFARSDLRSRHTPRNAA
jgi:hypothetical protein